VLAYLARYTHRVAIANRRLLALEDKGVTFEWKGYRAKGRDRAKVMTLAPHEFMRRFLIHVLPSGFHRLRHYGLFANGGRAENLARAASCSPCRRNMMSPIRPPIAMTRPCSRIPAHAVAAAWSSSRPSSAAAHHAIVRQR
jgi:hypothetical protein